MHFKAKGINRWKINGWRKIHHAKSRHKKVGMVLLISDKIVFFKVLPKIKRDVS